MTGIEDWNILVNEEFLVSVVHHTTLITSLPFVHTARRTYRLNDSVKLSDRGQDALGRLDRGKLFKPHHLEEGEVVTRFPLVNLRKDHYHTSSPLASAGGNIETTVLATVAGVLSPADLYIYGDFIVSQVKTPFCDG